MVLCEFDGEWFAAELASTAEDRRLTIHYGNHKYGDVEHAERQECVKEIDDVPLQELTQAKGTFRDKAMLLKLEVRC